MHTFKFHWGYGIGLFFTAFVVFILTAVFTSTKENIHLVTENYYAEELAYQERIDEIKNTSQLKGEVGIRMKEESVELSFPITKADIAGEIHFFRPSDAALDQKFNLALNTDGEQVISTENMASGYYKVKLTWQMEGKDFYKEMPVYLP